MAALVQPVDIQTAVFPQPEVLVFRPVYPFAGCLVSLELILLEAGYSHVTMNKRSKKNDVSICFFGVKHFW